MTPIAVTFGVLAVAAQLGVPVNPPGARAEARPPEAPLGEPIAVAPVPQTAGAAPFSLDGEAAAGLVERGRRALSRAPFADRLDAGDYVWIEATLERLTLREKVAQLVVAYLEGGQPREGSPEWRRARRLVTEERVGGFIVGVGSSQGTARWLNRLQTESAVPLLMAADLEWGPGTRLRGATVLPINMALAAAGAPEYAFEAGRITAQEARAAGIHMAFAPVADVNINPQNPVINTRSYGSDPAEVSRRVVEFVRGARSAGMLAVVKHFPGHGDTETDSHLEMPILSVDRLRLDEVELKPFRAAIAAGVEGVMTAHLAVPVLDSLSRLRPATLSAPILTRLLRDELEFGGLIITDALHMDGVKRRNGNGRVAVEALIAGADILLIPPNEKEAIDAVVAAVRVGELSEERIDASVRRVLASKALTGLDEDRRTDLIGLRAEVGRGEHEAWGRRAAERSITLVRGEPGTLPLQVSDRTILTVAYDDRRNHRKGQELEVALAERGARVITLRLSKSSDRAELARARRLAEGADITLFASFSRALPWKGTLGLPAEVAALAEELSRVGAPVISFGDPYLLRQLTGVSTYMLAWSDDGVSQRAAVRALTGEIPITGRLPIDLPPDYRVGDGLVVPSLPWITMVPALE